MEIKKDIAVITGASSGIGREFALILDDYGLDEIWLIARTEDKLESLRQQLYTPARVFALDLTKEADIEKYEEALKNDNPNIVYLINDSGFGKFGNYLEVTRRDSVDMIDLNAKSVVLMTMHSIRYMDKGSGIIQMSSSAAFTPLPNFAVYAATKSFVYSYGRALRRELRDKLINVTVVCPGWVDTDFFDVAEADQTPNRPKRFLPIKQPQEIAKKALKDCDNNRAVSICGIYTKLHKLASKLLPDCLLIAKWMCMQMK